MAPPLNLPEKSATTAAPTIAGLKGHPTNQPVSWYLHYLQRQKTQSSVCLASGKVDTALVRRHHVFDVDESIFATTLLKQGQGVADQLAQAVILLLPIVNAVAQVLVPAGMRPSSGVSRTGCGANYTLLQKSFLDGLLLC